ncbi:MAG TPA: sigma-70 family RNA polymerase sigma factor [Xanthobacteraceae bacterium]|jgi:RNA polymerase sigma-70 factor (ECF subfamily)
MQTGFVLRDVASPHLRAPVQESSDEALINRIAAGDKRAMQVLYGRHSVRVYRFILRLTGNQSLAEDLLSEVFLDVWRQAEGFEAKSQVSTWLLAIARYKALSALRRRVDEPLDEQMAATIEDTAESPETAVYMKDRNTIVQKCLRQLSPAHREVIDLVYYHEKSVDEVARIVGVPPATVKTRMFYARSKMADLLRQSGVSAP